MRDGFEALINGGGYVLTEGAVGQRLVREFGLEPDPDIVYAPLIYDRAGRDALASIYREYLDIATRHGLPLILMTNTRRANRERMLRSEYADRDIAQDYAGFLRGLAAEYECECYVGGMMGCKNDAYSGDQGLSVQESEQFHAWQAEGFMRADVDFMFAGIMPSLDEAIGMANVMAGIGKPYIISLMIRRDGRLLDGHTIDEAIGRIDGTARVRPLCYMTNCVHPRIVRDALEVYFNRTERVRERFAGIQANAAQLDPEALDGSEELLTTSAIELADEFELLITEFPLRVLGGCCGTDGSHIEELARRIGGKSIR